MKTDWIFLDGKANNESAFHITTDHMKISLSPYDIPVAVRGYTEEDQFYVIEFRYLTDEPVEVEKRGNLLQCGVGVNSGRIYRVCIDIHELKKFVQSDAVKNVYGALEQFPHNSDRLTRSYSLARSAIDANDTRLFEPLSHLCKK